MIGSGAFAAPVSGARIGRRGGGAAGLIGRCLSVKSRIFNLPEYQSFFAISAPAGFKSMR
jgi:hypothetical protein